MEDVVLLWPRLMPGRIELSTPSLNATYGYGNGEADDNGGGYGIGYGDVDGNGDGCGYGEADGSGYGTD